MLSRNKLDTHPCSSVNPKEQSESYHNPTSNAHQSRTKPTHHPWTHSRIYTSNGRTWGRCGSPSVGVAQRLARGKIGSPPMSFCCGRKRPQKMAAQTPIFPRSWAPTARRWLRPSPSSNRCSSTDCRKSIVARFRFGSKRRYRQQFKDGDWTRTDPSYSVCTMSNVRFLSALNGDFFTPTRGVGALLS